MAKLTKAQVRAHDKAVALLEKDTRHDHEIYFVLENWQPSVYDVTKREVFFTPEDWAIALRMESHTWGTYIDVCAGIGMLSGYHYLHERRHNPYENSNLKYICIESDERMVEVGRTLFPSFEWHVGDIHDEQFMMQFHFDKLGSTNVGFVSNPPFSRAPKSWVGGAPQPLMLMEMGWKLGWDHGTVLMGKGNAPVKMVKNYNGVGTRVNVSRYRGWFNRNCEKLRVSGSEFDSWGMTSGHSSGFIHTNVEVMIQSVEYDIENGTLLGMCDSYMGDK